TCGNSSLLRNRVVLLGFASDFEAALASMHLTLSEGGGRPLILNDFVWGAVTEAGHTIVSHPRGGLGEPLVAVTRDPLLLTSLNDKNAPGCRQRLLVSSRIELVLANFEAIQRFAESNRTLLVAGAAQRENARKLRDFGWTVWEPTGNDLPMARADQVPQTVRGLAESERALALDLRVGNAPQMRIKDPIVSGLFRCFSQVGSLVPSDDGMKEPLLASFADALNDVFYSLASWLRVPKSTSSDWHVNGRLLLDRSRALLVQVAGSAAASALDRFLEAVDEYQSLYPAGTITMKGRELLRIVDIAGSNESLKHRFVCSSQRTRDESTAFFASEGRKVACCTVQQMRTEDDVYRVVPMSIFNRQKFARLLDPWPANQLMLVGYDFELDIYQRRLEGRSRARAGLTLSRQKSSAISGLPETFFRPQSTHSSPMPAAPAIDTSSNGKFGELEIDGLDRLVKNRRPTPASSLANSTTPASIVNFAKNSWAALSPEHVVLVIGSDAAREALIQPRRAAELTDGSRLVMRE
ncbi:unnamed protein product, partial [Phaeothamnion confervicola]